MFDFVRKRLFQKRHQRGMKTVRHPELGAIDTNCPVFSGVIDL